MHKPLSISIVIPVFNERGYLIACLNSIAAQSVKPAEVIVVDNNSTDDSVAVAKSFSFVRILHEPRHQGVMFARNRGFNAARSDIIGRIDADTVLPASWVAEVVKTFEQTDGAALTGPVSYYDMPLPETNYRFNHLVCLFTDRFAAQGPFLFGTNMAIRTDVWHKVGPELCNRQDIHEDIDLAIHLRQSNQRIIYTKSLLAGVSGRRMNNKLSDYGRYIAMFPRAYRVHSLHNPTVYPATLLWILGYCLMHPRWLARRFMKTYFGKDYAFGLQQRKNPMTSQ